MKSKPQNDRFLMHDLRKSWLKFCEQLTISSVNVINSLCKDKKRRHTILSDQNQNFPKFLLDIFLKGGKYKNKIHPENFWLNSSREFLKR